MTRRIAAAGSVAAVAVAVVALGPATPAEAATCSRVMSVDYALPSGIQLSPSHVDVRYGDCVQFTNNTAPSVTIAVGKGYKVTLGYGESTSAGNSYAATDPGGHDVTATNGPATAGGTVTVGASPSPSPSPRTSQSSSAAASPHPSPSASSAGPQVAPSPHRPGHLRSGRPVPVPSLHPLPSASRVGPTPGVTPQVAPDGQPSPSATPAAVVAGPIEPPSGRGLGLPAALAALALVGVGVGFVRVLLAEPIPTVDNAQSVGATP